MLKNIAIFAACCAAALYATKLAVRQTRKMKSWQDQVVVITGGSRGLGLVLARKLMAAGAEVTLIARDRNELLRAEQYLLEHEVGTALILECDVTDQEQVKKRFQQIYRRFLRIDVLINNAGTIEVGPFDCMTVDDFKEAMNLHFWAPLYTSMEAIPIMRQGKYGRIVNIASIGGKISIPHMLPYSASKFAEVGLSEGLRAELIKDNILVTTVCPGLMRTGSHVNAYFKGDSQAEYEWFSFIAASPVFSVDAETAAEQIINACRYGEPELIISPQAQFLSKLEGIAPGLFSELASLAVSFMPKPDGIGRSRASGKQSQTDRSPSVLSSLSDRAAQKYNELNTNILL